MTTGKIDNPSVQALDDAISHLYTMNATSSVARALYDRWQDFLHGGTYALVPDATLFPVYKAFAVAYHLAWRLADNKPSDSPDIGLFTLTSEDVAERWDHVIEGVDTARVVALEAVQSTANAATKALGYGLGAWIFYELFLKRRH